MEETILFNQMCPRDHSDSSLTHLQPETRGLDLAHGQGFGVTGLIEILYFKGGYVCLCGEGGKMHRISDDFVGILSIHVPQKA